MRGMEEGKEVKRFKKKGRKEGGTERGKGEGSDHTFCKV